MTTARRRPDTRVLLLLIVLMFLAVMAWWWSLRAGRIEATTAPTPVVGPTAAPAGAATSAP